MISIDDLFNPNEKPLESFPADGGFTGIFRCIGCIGDSLSSGEFQATSEDGSFTYHDMFDYSWGQYLARIAGTRVINMSRGGMTAREYMESFADANGYWDAGAPCQAYLVALGCNDVTHILRGTIELGEMTDICPEDWTKNAPTVTGYYAQILQKIFAAQKDVHFFLVTMPREDHAEERIEPTRAMNERIRELAAFFPRCHVIDLEKYAPEYDAAFREKFFMDGHMNPAGYLFTARMMASYMDYIIRHNMDEFMQVGFWGTDLSNKNYIK